MKPQAVLFFFTWLFKLLVYLPVLHYSLLTTPRYLLPCSPKYLEPLMHFALPEHACISHFQIEPLFSFKRQFNDCQTRLYKALDFFLDDDDHNDKYHVGFCCCCCGKKATKTTSPAKKPEKKGLRVRF